MSDDRFDPQEGYREAAPVTRHRRSDKYRREEEAPALEAPASASPAREEEEQRQWVRQQPPVIAPAPEEGQRPQPQQVISTRDQRYMRPPQADPDAEEEYEDDEEGGGFPWVKVLLAVLALLVVLLGALYFIKDAGPLTPVGDKLRGLIGGQKEPGQVISFQTTANSGFTDSRLEFHVTTNTAVDGVRLEDEEGSEVVCKPSMVSGEKDTNRIWSVTAMFDEPFEGSLYVAIREGETWTRTSFSVPLSIVSPTPAPTATPLPTQAPVATETPRATAAPAPTDPPRQEEAAAPEDEGEETPGEEAELPEDTAEWTLFDPDETEDASSETAEATAIPMVTWVPVFVPTETEAPPTPEPTEEPTAAPTQAPTAVPTPVPTPEPTPAPTAEPTASPMPRLEASGSGSVKMTETVYNEKGKAVKNFTRERGYIAPNPDQYSRFEIGLFTFRGDNFRRNAAFGTADVQGQQLSVIWKSPIGSLRTADNGTLYGVGWTGQPAIIKWTKEVREMMNLNEDKKTTTGLREVIFGAQDGKIYFLDIKDGSATREPITVGYPLKGSVSVDAMGRPLISVGQGISKLSSKTGDIGMHVYNLVDGKKAFFINGRKSSTQPQYSTNGAFDGTALFLYDNDAMVVAGENGLLYTIDLNSQFTYPNVNDPDAVGSLSVKRSTTFLRAKASGEKDNLVSVESSVAMYDKYAYVADTYGIVRCVDTDTMQTVWAFDNGDNTDIIALDMEGDSGVSLYTGNTAYSRLTSKKDVSIRKLNALTGQEIWHYDLKCSYDKEQLSGCKASPVVGQHGISDLVIYTVNKVDGGGSRILALDKETGKVVWQKSLSAEAISSPVAVYNEQGEAWIIQGDEKGTLTMLQGRTGDVCTTLELGGKIQGSPAVYKDTLVIGTCDKDNSFMYGIKIQ